MNHSTLSPPVLTHAQNRTSLSQVLCAPLLPGDLALKDLLGNQPISGLLGWASSRPGGLGRMMACVAVVVERVFSLWAEPDGQAAVLTLPCSVAGPGHTVWLTVMRNPPALAPPTKTTRQSPAQETNHFSQGLKGAWSHLGSQVPVRAGWERAFVPSPPMIFLPPSGQANSFCIKNQVSGLKF